MDEQTQSPSPARQAIDTRVDFYEALKAAINGKKITKLEWGDENIYGLISGEILKLHKEDDKLYNWIISEADMQGDDWVVL